MPDLTLKRMDAAIRRVLDIADPHYGGPVVPLDCRIFLAGMQAAAKLALPARRETVIADFEFAQGWNDGHDAHQQGIRATVKRLGKEMKVDG